jgi:hypothetical protein
VVGRAKAWGFPFEESARILDTFGRCHHRGNILSSHLHGLQRVYGYMSKASSAVLVKLTRPGLCVRFINTVRLPFAVFNALDALLLLHNAASSHALSLRSEYSRDLVFDIWTPQRPLDGIGQFNAFIRRIQRKTSLNPGSLDLATRGSEFSQSSEPESDIEQPFHGVLFPTTSSNICSDQHRSCLLRLCSAFRLSQPLDVLFRTCPLGLVSCRIRPWVWDFQRFPLSSSRHSSSLYAAPQVL